MILRPTARLMQRPSLAARTPVVHKHTASRPSRKHVHVCQNMYHGYYASREQEQHLSSIDISDRLRKMLKELMVEAGTPGNIAEQKIKNIERGAESVQGISKLVQIKALSNEQNLCVAPRISQVDVSNQ